MELAAELLGKLLENRQINVTFPGLKLTAPDILEAASYQALCQIQDILRDDTLDDDTLDDPACFQKIEEIVQVFEQIGADCGSRHDF